jgi:hypothetical protein
MVEKFYEMSDDNHRPYTSIIDILNSKPRDMRYPICYERNEKVTKFILPVENPILMPNKKYYPI